MVCILKKKAVVFTIILLFIGASITPNIYGSVQKKSEGNNVSINKHYCSLPNNCTLDIQYIYNITKALSDIIFTEYNETQGEIAKGREFGTKGEHKAAQILIENMTLLGLYTTKQQIQNLTLHPTLTNKVDILEYGVTLHNGTYNETVDCYINQQFHGNPSEIQNVTWNGLKIRREHPSIKEDNEDYVLLQPPGDGIDLTGSFPCLTFFMYGLIYRLKDSFEHLIHPHYKAKICFDTNNETHDIPGTQSVIPTITINGSLGNKINESIEDFTVDFHIRQQLNTSVISYNVIGQLNGTDPTKSVLVCCLYDGWWCQATGDSAIGMGIVLGIAKYFIDHHIKPQYTIKFIGFGGEEVGMRGSIYYQATHRFEDIEYVIDLNQLGFNQTQPRLTLQVAANNKPFLQEIWGIVQKTDYVNRTGNVTNILPVFMPVGHISDDHSFALVRPVWRPIFGCKTICFLKNGRWLNHHRDGENHTKGDVLEDFDWDDVSATGEIILNVTKHLTLDSQCTLK